MKVSSTVTLSKAEFEEMVKGYFCAQGVTFEERNCSIEAGKDDLNFLTIKSYTPDHK